MLGIDYRKPLMKVGNAAIYDVTRPGQSFGELSGALGVIDRYAKANNVKVAIYDPVELYKPVHKPIRKICEDYVAIEVHSKKPFECKTANVKYNTEPGEEPFLRRVYKSIQKMVTGEDKLPVEKEVEATRARYNNYLKTTSTDYMAQRGDVKVKDPHTMAGNAYE